MTLVDVESVLKPIEFDISEAARYNKIAESNAIKNVTDRVTQEKLAEYWLGKYIALSNAKMIIEREAGIR